MKRKNGTQKNQEKKNTVPMDKALRYLGHSARTVREMERYLDDCQYGEVEVYETVQRLLELNLLNDEAYAEEFVRTRLAAKPVSRAHLREQMRAKELPQEIIDQALASVSDETEAENAFAVAEKYMRQLQELPEEERRERVLRRAASRGFSYDVAKAALERLETAPEEP